MAADDAVGLAGRAAKSCPPPTADHMLVELFVLGDYTDATFELFVREVQPAATAYVRRASPGLGHADAEDIVQTALVKMYQRWRLFSVPESAKAYFFSVLRTGTADHFRALARNRAKVERSALAYTEAEPDHRLDAVEIEMTLESILDANPHLRSLILELLAKDREVPDLKTLVSMDFDRHPRRDLLEVIRFELRARLEQAGLGPPRNGRVPSIPAPRPGPVCPACQQPPRSPAPSAAGVPSHRSGAVPPAAQIWPEAAFVAEHQHDRRQREWLEREISRLPPREQQVSRLAASGATPAQIAERIGISANNARVTLWHARKKLQAKINVSSERLDLLFKRPSLVPVETCPICL
ncbi:sigma-70 family RNA polymerase sigma factor [Kitasatospora sp. NPDC089797]|uniref:sigma-70 family RNA polymerase sigma factor n=1 Tax=Kitasatospora sp. NPDC089797 TaxID=3155298 RepID=UPI0034278536